MPFLRDRKIFFTKILHGPTCSEIPQPLSETYLFSP